MPFRSSIFACACVVLAALSLGFAGCGATPTLPLPPPVAMVGSPNLQGLVLVSGTANEDAYVMVLNERIGVGEIQLADAEGAFAIEIPAVVGDTLLLWQERDGITGERSEQTVPPPRP